MKRDYDGKDYDRDKYAMALAVLPEPASDTRRYKQSCVTVHQTNVRVYQNKRDVVLEFEVPPPEGETGTFTNTIGIHHECALELAAALIMCASRAQAD